MATLQLFYATNRAHEGGQRWAPRRYGRDFSSDGIENLRFGRLEVDYSQAAVDKHLRAAAAWDRGDGEKLSGYLAGKAKRARITAYEENLDRAVSDRLQDPGVLGSRGMFNDLRVAMCNESDVVIYIHGFNVSWEQAVGGALALQLMLNREGVGDPAQHTLVVLFTWPSDGMALPFASYKSDRTEGAGSGYAVGRGLLKLRDFLRQLADRPEGGRPDPSKLCGQDLHLLCHSMGNYVLQSALTRLREMHEGRGLPRMFEHVFLCAPDVDDDVLEPGQPMGDLHSLARTVTVYHNTGDVAMYVSDYSKGNPERLGTNGAARPPLLHNKVHQLDCSTIVKGLVEHSYYLWGPVATDIRLSVDGARLDDTRRHRMRDDDAPNVWRLLPPMEA